MIGWAVDLEKLLIFFFNFLRSNFTIMPRAYDRHFPLHSHKSKQVNDSSDSIFLPDKTLTPCYKKRGQKGRVKSILHGINLESI